MARGIPLWKDRYPESMAFLRRSMASLPTQKPQVWAPFLKQSGLDDQAGRRAVAIGEDDPLLVFFDLGRSKAYSTMTSRREFRWPMTLPIASSRTTTSNRRSN